MNSRKFANSFCSKFKKTTSSMSPYEIPLFRALQKTLRDLSPKFHIEEYHGAKHQVTFPGSGPWTRAKPRCELADLFFVIFNPRIPSVRITFFQAKSERRIITKKCVLGEPYSANLEQWDLLGYRPPIKGCSSFMPPTNILSKAILPSVGTFGFFYKHSRVGDYQILYSTGDNLCLYSPSVRYGKLITKKSCRFRSVHGYVESTASCSNFQFAYNLYNNKIGSPIHHEADAKNPDSANPITRLWLANTLKQSISEAREENRSTDIAQELLDSLETDPDEYQSQGFGAKSMFILKTDKING